MIINYLESMAENIPEKQNKTIQNDTICTLTPVIYNNFIMYNIPLTRYAKHNYVLLHICF